MSMEGVRMSLEGVRMSLEAIRMSLEDVRISLEVVRVSMEGVRPGGNVSGMSPMGQKRGGGDILRSSGVRSCFP